MKSYILKFINIIIHSKTKALVAVACMLMLTQSVYAYNVDKYAASSVLSSGKWVKVKVDATGIYQISATDARNWGFSDLSKVKVYGYGGNMLSEVFSANMIDDLPQLPVLRTADKIYFYALGTISWSYNTSGYIHSQHAYAKSGYYFITENDAPDNVMYTASPASNATNVVNTFTDYVLHENEINSPGGTGRQLYGEDFRYTKSQTFKFNLTDNVGENVRLTSQFIGKIVNGTGSLSYTANGEALNKTSSDNVNAVTSAQYEHFRTATSNKTINLSGDDLSLGITFSSSGTVSAARLDFLRLTYTRALQMSGNSLLFRNSTAYVVGGAKFVVDKCTSSTQIWDVTDASAPFNVGATLSGTQASFVNTIAGAREYAAFNTGATYTTPTFVASVNNQDIHAMDVPDMVIVTNSALKAQAERVAQLHRNIDNMTVYVFEQEPIYNEFSSGTPDITAIRKMLKMWYDRGDAGGTTRLKYLLFFGRGTYDNRQLTSSAKALTYEPILSYQSIESSNENDSYTTDDYCGFLDDGSGAVINDAKLRIGVGRMPVKDVAEAKTVVDKLYRYVQDGDYGQWKNNVIVFADDEDSGIHMTQAENVISRMQTDAPEYVYNKLYIDAYEAESAGSGRTYPGAKSQLFKLLNDGALVFDYIGHANTVSWTHDGILNINDINSMYLKHYPLFITATCEFSRFDADEVSGGEIMYLNGRGGGIAMISTSRLVYIADNGVLNNYMAAQIFKRDADGGFQTVGDILKNAKCSYSVANGNKLRYVILGDPAMRLAYPKYNIKITEMNGQPIAQAVSPTARALDKVTFKGEVYDTSGNKATEYSGVAYPTVYDSERSVVTHGYGNGVEFAFQQRNSRIYVGCDSVKNGEFEFSFIVPKEINYNWSPGLINLYAKDNLGMEANGYEDSVYFYGYNDDADMGEDGPEIQYVYLNNENFNNGDVVNESPMAIISFYDKNGINLSESGIGHSMKLILDDKTTYTNVSSYYSAAVDEYGRGYVYYPMSDLSEGEHTLTFKVCNVNDISSEHTINFIVEKGLKPSLLDVYADCNPATVSTNFYLKHDRPDALIQVTVEVFNTMGQEVWTHTETGMSDMFRSFPINWNLTDNSGSKVPYGMYIYRATISTDGTHESTQSKKLFVNPQ